MPCGSCRGIKINNEAAISPFTQSRSHMHSVGGFPYPAFLIPNGNHCSESASHCFLALWYEAKRLLLACIPPRMRAYNMEEIIKNFFYKEVQEPSFYDS